MTGADSIFSPLDVSTDEIRLLDVLPSLQFTAKISCRLRVVSLDDSPVFDALSWCWGDALEKSAIELNDQHFQCTTNLEVALRYFRDSEEMRALWVDATCINEQDLLEKGRQILLMRRIYKQADTVRIWLGESADDSDVAVRVFRQLQQQPTFGDFQLDGQPLTETQISAFCALLDRPWWGRIWVMQEFTLARQAIFHCGRSSFPADDFVQTILDLVNSLYPSYLMWKSTRGEEFKAKELVHAIAGSLRSTYPLIGFIDCLKKIEQGDAPIWRVVEAVISLTPLNATNPRDKVFGCIGSLPELLDLITPDYLQPVEVVYTDATWALICFHQSFFPLCFLRPQPQKTIELQGEHFVVPSWTLNFAKDITKFFTLSTMFPDCSPWGSFNTTANYPFLETSGVYFDEITQYHPMEPDWEADIGPSANVKRWRYLHERWRRFFGLELGQSDHSAYIGGGSIDNAYWRTIACDLFGVVPSVTDRLGSTTINAFARWVRDPSSHELHPGQPDWEINQVVDTYTAAINIMSFGKNTYLFLTKRGYIGMSAGVPDIRVGDHLYFLERGQVSWAIRPIKHEAEETAVFQVISECYIHGIMDGEAFGPAPKIESKVSRRHELRRRVFGGSMLDSRLPLTLSSWTRIRLA